MALKLKYEKVMVKDNTDRVKNAESTIVQQAEQIALKVTLETFNALAGRVTEAEASLTVQADAIALKVSQQTFNELLERVGTAESSIEQQADNIALKVSSSDFTGTTIASLINQSAAAIKIKAAHIQLEGIVTANSFFKILADGSIEAVNAKLSGAISATKMVSSVYDYLYGEVGMTDGAVGLGLFDTRQGTQAFVELVELEDSGGIGFGIRDKNNISRIQMIPTSTSIKDAAGVYRFYATPTHVSIRDAAGVSRFSGADTASYMYSPTAKNYIAITENSIQFIKNGVVVASW